MRKKIFKIVENINNDTIHIPDICVDLSHRRKGIATNLIKRVKNTYPTYIFDLDVVADNYSAINLYQKEGFKIIKKKKGFNGFRKRKPYIYNMKLFLK